MAGDVLDLDFLPRGFTFLFGITEAEDPPAHGLGVLRKMSLPKSKMGMAPANDLQDFSLEKLQGPGFYEEEPLAFECRLHQTDYLNLRTVHVLGYVVNWQITFPLLSGQTTPLIFGFEGFVEELGIPEVTAAQDERMNLTFTVKASKIDITYAT